MAATPGQAQARLDAAELTGDEAARALTFLCGYCPDGITAAVGTVLQARRWRPITRPDPVPSSAPLAAARIALRQALPREGP